MAWSAVACLTALVGIAAALQRNQKLALLFGLLFALRGVWCGGELIYAFLSNSSCPAWALSKNFWLPFLAVAYVLAFGGLALKFSRSTTTEAAIRFAG